MQMWMEPDILNEPRYTKYAQYPLLRTGLQFKKAKLFYILEKNSSNYSNDFEVTYQIHQVQNTIKFSLLTLTQFLRAQKTVR